MAKKGGSEFICQSCGSVYPRWQGKCDACGEWNTIVEEKIGGEGFSNLPSKRKGKMIEIGDIFVVLPGGIGTIDEWISTLSDMMVMETRDANADRPIVVVNHNGMYDATIAQLASTNESIFARGRRVDRSLIVTDIPQMLSALTTLSNR